MKPTKEQCAVALAMVEAGDMGPPPFAEGWTAQEEADWIASTMRLAMAAIEGEADRRLGAHTRGLLFDDDGNPHENPSYADDVVNDIKRHIYAEMSK